MRKPVDYDDLFPEQPARRPAKLPSMQKQASAEDARASIAETARKVAGPATQSLDALARKVRSALDSIDREKTAC